MGWEIINPMKQCIKIQNRRGFRNQNRKFIKELQIKENNNFISEMKTNLEGTWVSKHNKSLDNVFREIEGEMGAF